MGKNVLAFNRFRHTLSKLPENSPATKGNKIVSQINDLILNYL